MYLKLLQSTSHTEVTIRLELALTSTYVDFVIERILTHD